MRRQIFDPFFTTKELKGSGLGLWVSKNLVMDHHRTFVFELPPAKEQAEPRSKCFFPWAAWLRTTSKVTPPEPPSSPGAKSFDARLVTEFPIHRRPATRF